MGVVRRGVHTLPYRGPLHKVGTYYLGADEATLSCLRSGIAMMMTMMMYVARGIFGVAEKATWNTFWFCADTLP